MNWLIIIGIALVLAWLKRSEILDFIMYQIGEIYNLILKEERFTEFPFWKEVEYKWGGYMGYVVLSTRVRGEGVVKLSYELGLGEKTDDFFYFGDTYSKDGYISVRLFLGNEPCRMRFHSDDVEFVGDWELNTQAPITTHKANFFQKLYFSRYKRIKLQGNNLTPYNDDVYFEIN